MLNDPNAMSFKAAAFLAALKQLCISHRVQLCVSDYDNIEIWDLLDGESPVGAPDIKDMTKC